MDHTFLGPVDNTSGLNVPPKGCRSKNNCDGQVHTTAKTACQLQGGAAGMPVQGLPPNNS